MQIQSQCPVTKGCATSMSQESFDAHCKAKRGEYNGSVPMWQYCHIGCKRRVDPKHYPKELTFKEISKEERNKMSTTGKCEGCGQRKNLNMNNGKEVCSTCSVVRGAAKNRPGAVMDAIRDFHPLHILLTREEIEKAAAKIGAADESIEHLRAELLAAKADLEKLKMENASLLKVVEECRPADDLSDLAFDLAMGCISGEITGLKPEQLMAIRGA